MNTQTEYADRKHRRKKIKYIHEKMKEISEKTQGILVFQEQTMEVFLKIAGLTESLAYKFIKGCSKKKKTLVQQMVKQFIEGCASNGIDKRIAKKIASDLQKWAGYGFNASHAYGYALNESFITAYLKAHYPAEFMTTRLSIEYRRKSERHMKVYREEIQRMGYRILPPDVNESGLDWMIIDPKTVRESLLVKGIGEKAALDIVEHRPYGGDDLMYGFARKVGSAVSSKIVEAMWDAGMWANYSKEKAVSDFDKIRKDKRRGGSSKGVELF